MTQGTDERRGDPECGRRRRGCAVGRGGGVRGVEEGAGVVEIGASRGTPEPVVAHLRTAAREDVLQEPAKKLDAREGGAPDLLGTVVAIPKGDVVVVNLLEPTVADGDAKEIPGEVVEHARAIASGLRVDHPHGVVHTAAGACASRPACCTAAHILARTIPDIAWTGTRNAGCFGATHCVRSAESPPAVTMRWTCG